MHSLLENFLNSVARRLWALPRTRREEELCELRQHLTRLDADCRAQGMTEEDAGWATLAHFGSPHLLGCQIACTWWRGRLLSWITGPVGTTAAASLLLYLPTLLLHMFLPNQEIGSGRILVHIVPVWFSAVWCALVGVSVGRRTARRTLRSTVCITLIATALVIGFQPFLMWPTYRGMPHLVLLQVSATYLSYLFQSLLYGWAFCALFMAPSSLLGRAWALRH
jgi:hypothetical protein